MTLSSLHKLDSFLFLQRLKEHFDTIYISNNCFTDISAGLMEDTLEKVLALRERLLRTVA